MFIQLARVGEFAGFGVNRSTCCGVDDLGLWLGRSLVLSREETHGGGGGGGCCDVDLDEGGSDDSQYS